MTIPNPGSPTRDTPLPERPDLDQLRRQARELHRAAVAGDPSALHLMRPAPGRVTLSAAQLAVAREHGFPSWPRLKAEVERRQAARRDAEPQLHRRPPQPHRPPFPGWPARRRS